MSNTEPGFLPEKLKQMQLASLGLGTLGIVVMLMAHKLPNFYQGYLVGWLFAMSFALGGLLILCVHNLANGGWGFLIRRIGEASAMTILPLMLLFLPIMFGAENLYLWAMDQGTAYAHDPIVGPKMIHWLNMDGMWLRYILYAAIWGGGAILFWTWSGKQDETGELTYRRKARFLAGPLALIYVLTVTFWSVDVVMSLEPMWFSSIFGVMFACGHMLTILTFGILFLLFLSRWEPIKSELTVERQHDLGKLLFAFVIFWAYVEVSQYLIYWHANLPEEVVWYANRSTKFYQPVSLVLVMSQFVIPFLVLLSRGVKRNSKKLAAAASFLLALRVLDLWWIVSPSISMPESKHLYTFGHTKAMSGASLHWLDLLGPVSFGLFWFGLFLYFFRQRPILPLNDPFFSREPEIKQEGN